MLIRTFLSFSLETELEGRVPWKKERAQRGGERAAPPPSSATGQEQSAAAPH